MTDELTAQEISRMSDDELRSRWHHQMGTLEGDHAGSAINRHTLERNIEALEREAIWREDEANQ
jgi:hypothetical protein